MIRFSRLFLSCLLLAPSLCLAQQEPPFFRDQGWEYEEQPKTTYAERNFDNFVDWSSNLAGAPGSGRAYLDEQPIVSLDTRFEKEGEKALVWSGTLAGGGSVVQTTRHGLPRRTMKTRYDDDITLGNMTYTPPPPPYVWGTGATSGYAPAVGEDTRSRRRRSFSGGYGDYPAPQIEFGPSPNKNYEESRTQQPGRRTLTSYEQSVIFPQKPLYAVVLPE